MPPMSRTSQTLTEMYEAMRARFGHQGWWPGDGALEICVGAILTQNTNWRNVERAIANLKADGLMSVSALQAVDAERLAERIRPAGYFRVKARRLKNFVTHVYEGFGDDVEAFLDRSVATLREELLSVRGIGPETADSMILYAAGKPTFVVDTYTCRVLVRHGLVAPEDGYEQVKDVLESSLPQDAELWNDFHAQFVAVGKQYCKPRARCLGCPLEPFEHDPEAGRTDV
jgi:endonuclease-3 related protein